MLLTETLYNQMIIEDEFYNESIDIMRQKFRLTLSESVLLQEGTVKDFFTKIWEGIKLLWSKFIEKLDTVFKSNEEWFKKYEDDLMKANLRNFEWNMIPYWQGDSVLAKVKVPMFNPQNKEQLTYCETTEAYREFIKKTYTGNNKNLKTDDNFTESLAYLFRGGSASLMKGTEIASILKNAIFYCKNFKTVYNKVQLDYNNIEKSIKQAEREAIKTVNAPKKDDKAVKSEAYLFNEADTNTQQSTNNPNDKTKNQVKDVNQQNQELLKKQKDTMDTTNSDKKDYSDSEVQNFNMSKEDADKRITAYKNYVTVSQQVLSTKLTILQERYDMYMKMFKAILDISLKQKAQSGNELNSGEKVRGKDYYEKQIKANIENLNNAKSKSKNKKEKGVIDGFISDLKNVFLKVKSLNTESLKHLYEETMNKIKSTLTDFKESK